MEQMLWNGRDMICNDLGSIEYQSSEDEDVTDTCQEALGNRDVTDKAPLRQRIVAWGEGASEDEDFVEIRRETSMTSMTSQSSASLAGSGTMTTLDTAFSQALERMISDLDDGESAVLTRLRPDLEKAHTVTLATSKHTRQHEHTDVNTTVELLRAELEREKVTALKEQHQQLTDEYNHSLEQLQREFKQLETTASTTQEMGVQSDIDVEDTGHEEEIRRLRASLGEQHLTKVDLLKVTLQTQHQRDTDVLREEIQHLQNRLVEEQQLRLDDAPVGQREEGDPRPDPTDDDATGDPEPEVTAMESHQLTAQALPVPELLVDIAPPGEEWVDDQHAHIERIASQTVAAVLQNAVSQLELEDKDLHVPSDNNNVDGEDRNTGDQSEEDRAQAYSDSFEGQSSDSSSVAQEIDEEEIDAEVDSDGDPEEDEEYSLVIENMENLLRHDQNYAYLISEEQDVNELDQADTNLNVSNKDVEVDETQDESVPEDLMQFSISNIELTSTPDKKQDLRLGVDSGADSRLGVDSGADLRLGMDSGADSRLPMDSGADSRLPVDSGADSRLPVDSGAEATPAHPSVEDEYRGIVNESAEMLQRHQLELENIKAQHLDDLEDVRIAIKSELLNDNLRRLGEMTSELEKSHSSELEEIRQQYREQVELLEVRLKLQEGEVKQALGQQIESLQLEHQQRLELLKHELQASHQDEMQSVNQDTQQIKSELDAAHQRELEEMYEKHSKELDQISDKHSEELDQISNKHSKELDQQKDKHSEEMDQQKDKHSKELDQQKDKHSEELDQQKDKHIKELENIDTQYKSLIQELETKQTENVQEVSSLREEISQLHQELEASEHTHQQAQADLTAQVEHLTAQREQTEKLERRVEEYEVTLGRRNREREEEFNLMTILRSDLDNLSEERTQCGHTNEQLLRLLSEAVKTNLAAEERINRRLASLLTEGGQGHSQQQALSPALRDVGDPTVAMASGPSSHGGLSQESQDSTPHNTSLTSAFSDEGLELSQRLSESLFAGPDLDGDGEEFVLDTGHRLQTAVERLLDMMTDTTRQLLSTQDTQKDLVTSLDFRGQEIADLTQKCEDLEQSLQEAQEAKDYLAVELNRAEGLVQGYQTEQGTMDESIKDLEDRKETLIEELEHMRSRLTELELSQDEVTAREENLSRQRQALESSVSSEEKVLLQENERLSEEKRQLERQHTAERDGLLARLEQYESFMEDERADHEQTIEARRDENQELSLQIEALDKQLRANRQFLEEQTNEREQEREEFQREVDVMKGQLKEREKVHSAGKRLSREVQDLEEQLRDRIDSHNQLILKKEQLERDSASQDVTNQELRDMIRTLEVEVDARTHGENDLKKRVSDMEKELSRVQGLNVDLELKRTEPSDLEEVTSQIADLEAQVATLKTSEQLAWQKYTELQEELKNLATLEEELTHDKEALQQQVIEQLQQISSLKVKVDELKLGYQPPTSTDSLEEMEELQRLLDVEKEALAHREHEVRELTEQLDQFRDQLVEREEDYEQLAAQLDVEQTSKQHAMDDLTSKIDALQTDNAELRSQVKSVQDQAGSTTMPVFAQTLIDDKNEEIDHLNMQIDRLKVDLVQVQMTEEAPTGRVDELLAELADKNAELAAKSQEIEELRLLVESMKESERLAREATEELIRTNDQGEHISQLTNELDTLKAQLSDHQQLIKDQTEVQKTHKSEVDEYNSALQQKGRLLEDKDHLVEEKDRLLDQLRIQTESLQAEIDNLTDFQTRLQEDYDTLQSLADSRDKQIESLNAEIDRVRIQGDGVSDLQAQFELDVQTLRKELQERDNIIEEKAEELYISNEALEKKTEELQHLQNSVQEKSDEIEQLHNSLEGKSEKIEEQQSSIQEKSTKIEQQQSSIQEKSDEIEQLQNSLEEKSGEIEQLQNSVEEKSVEIEQLQNSLEEKSVEIEQLQMDVGEKNSNILQLQIEADERADKLEQLSLEVEDRSSEIQQLQTEVEDKTAELLHLHRETAQAASQKQERLEAAMVAQQEKLHDDYSSKIEEARQSWTNQHDQEIGQLVARHEAELTSLKQAAIDLSDDDSLAMYPKEVPKLLARGQRLDRQILGSSLGLSHVNYDRDDSSFSSMLQAILGKLHQDGEGVLSLSEMSFLKTLGQPQSLRVGHDLPWDDEKRSLVATIKSLRELVADMQKTKDASKSDLSSYDWRMDLFRAIHNVFTQENNVLLSELHTHSLTRGPDVAPSIERLQNKVREQESVHRASLQEVMSADRESMLGEIHDLSRTVSMLKESNADSKDHYSQQVTAMEHEFIQRETNLKRQAELLEHKVSQEKVIADDLRTSLQAEKSRSIEILSQLNREKVANSELSSEIDDTQAQLDRLKEALGREQQRLVSASSALEGERKKSTGLHDALFREQKNVEAYIDELEQEKQERTQLKDRTNKVIEKLKRDIENEKERRVEALSQLEHEKLSLSSIRRDLDLEKDQHHVTDTKYKVRVADLRTTLDMEKARCNELNSALHRERHLVAQLRDTLNEERGSVHEAELRDKVNVADLQATLDLERSRILELQAALERERLKVSALSLQLDEEKTRTTDTIEKEGTVNRHLKHTMDSLQIQNQELVRELQFAGEKVSTLKLDRDHLHASLQVSKDRLSELEKQRLNASTQSKDREREEIERVRQMKQETEMHRLHGRVADLEQQLAECKRQELHAREERDLLQLKQAALHHGRRSNIGGDQDIPSTSRGVGTTPPKERSHVLRKQLESLRQKVQLLVIRQQEQMARIQSRAPDGVNHGPELSSISHSLKVVLNELEDLQSNVNSHGTISSEDRSSAVTTLNERILQHNSDLTGFIARISDEKQELRQTMSKLEEEIWNYRQREKVFLESENAEADLSSERQLWSQEKTTLTLRINDLEREVNNLKDVLRRAEIDLEREREKYLRPHGINADKTDSEKVQRLYGKYLRAESFRKALIYQKKYLLILLGGFKECEEQTLAEIARMGGYPAPSTQRPELRHSAPYTRFRSAVRVVIAVSRFQFLVRKWRRATRVGVAPITGGAINNGVPSYVPPIAVGVVLSQASPAHSKHRAISSSYQLPVTNSPHQPRSHQPASYLPTNSSHQTSSANLRNTAPSAASSSHRVKDSANHRPKDYVNGLESSHSRNRTLDSSSRNVRVNGHLGDTPPTRDLGNLRKYRDLIAEESRYPSKTKGVESPARRQLIVDDVRDVTPPPSRTGRDTPSTTDGDVNDAASNDYIQWLENLQTRLGSASHGTAKGFPIQRR